MVGVVTARGEGSGGGVTGGGVIGGGVMIDGVVGTKLNVSLADGNGEDASNGSGLAASRGLIVLLGSGFGVEVGDVFGFTVEAGDGLGFGVGLGVSSAAAGVLARNGVDAASCPRTSIGVARSARTKTKWRMMSVFSVNSCGDASLRVSGGSRAIPCAADLSYRWRFGAFSGA